MTALDRDIEFWLVLAELIEGARTLPESASRRFTCEGLCSALVSAYSSGLISFGQRHRLDRQLELARPRGAGGYWWKAGAWRSRARACRRIAAKLTERRK